MPFVQLSRPLALLLLALAFVAAQSPRAADRPSALRYELPELKQYLPQRPPDAATLAPRMPERQAILERATTMLGTPYLWGGNSDDGLDCSAFVSKAWATTRRHTTDSLPWVATMIGKDELLPGDVLDLQTWEHAAGYGHVRIFAAWADAARTKMWTFEERYPQGAIYHVVSYDDHYTPLRYDPLFREGGTATLILPNAEN